MRYETSVQYESLKALMATVTIGRMEDRLLLDSAPNSPAIWPAGPVWRIPRPDVVESRP
jgi:hypothetical protein